ncbi:MAG: hypothetical protein OET90_08315 [Desulfuromonadales bacterium]|nr:hypothetical protein [Desulfuromonadales bacterium]
MKATKTYRITLCLLFVCASFLLLSSPAFAKSGAHDLKELKKAALQCEVSAFTSFMPQSTRHKVLNNERQMEHLNQIMDAAYNKSVKMFGDGVVRTSRGFQIPISGKDPRWGEFFGPQWGSFVKTYPDGPFHYDIKIYFEWEQECDVVQRFQACLEDQSFCSGYEVKGSALRISEFDGSWKLIYNVPEKEEKTKKKLIKLGFDLALWIDLYLDKHEDTHPDEDFKHQFASEYTQRLQQLLSKIK